MVFQLNTKETPVLSQVGGKAKALIEAAKAGFPVPGGIVLSVEFFSSWLHEIMASTQWATLLSGVTKEHCDAVKNRAMLMDFTKLQKEELEKYLQKQEAEKMFAVRSSSPEEDMAGASFAGIYESVLGVTASGIENAVKTCFASAFDERVITYKNNCGLDPFTPQIAVIIQEQIASQTSGVAFSLNPVSNDYDEAVINANWGLGTTVVDGTITPDLYTVNTVTNSIVEKISGKKELACYLKDKGGTETRKRDDRSSLCLTDKKVLDIAALTKKVEKQYNRPMDIEWAYEGDELYLLQARPVTAYIQLPLETITEPGQPKKLYQDGLLTEQGLVENLSPLGDGVLFKMTVMIGGAAEKLFEAGIFIISGGRMYSDAGMMIKLMGKKNYIKTIEMVDSLGARIIENLDLKMYIPKKLPRGVIWNTIKMGIENSKGLSRAIKAYKNPSAYLEYFLEETKKLKEDLKREFESDNSFKDFVTTAFKREGDWMMNTSLPTLYAAEMARSKIKKTFKKEPKEIQDQIFFLEQAFPHNVTIEMGLLLYELSLSPDVKGCSSSEEFVKKIQKNQFSPEFMEKWQSFMKLHGHRHPRELDVASSRYRERPEEIFRIIKDMALGHTSEMTPQKTFEQGVNKRKETFKMFTNLLKKKGKREIKKFQKRYEVLSSFAAYREIHKYYLIVVIDYIRRRALSLAEKWVQDGRLDSVKDVFQMKFDEVARAEMDPELNLQPQITANKSYYESLQTKRPLSSLIDSRGRIPTIKPPPGSSGEILGTPVSFGVIKGPVKVLHRPDEKPILPGDILVTVATDPGWTTLFLNAGGILLESGGTLQHGASVARESCKPCIVGLEGITRRLRDGQIVEIDGATGIVTIIEEYSN